MMKFGTAVYCTKGTLDYDDTDVWGPKKKTSLGDKIRFVTFVDNYSRRVWVNPMRCKSDVFNISLKWKTMVEK